ncbi:hypothetical protein QUC31_001946 [Theobroma cacao]
MKYHRFHNLDEEVCSVDCEIGKDNLEDVEVDKEVCFVNCEVGKEDLVVLPNCVRTLTVEGCHDLKSLSNISLFCEANELKTCTIGWCEGIECMVDLSLSSYNSLQNIEVLSLRSLSNLHELVKGRVAVVSTSHTPAPPAIFLSLKKFHLIRCSSIKNLFSVQLSRGLQNLEYIEVNRCEKMEKIIASEEEEENHRGEERSPKITTYVFPKLQTLHLIKLPELKSICSSGVMVPANSLQYL